MANTQSLHGPVWVVLPTYNEAENIEPMVAALRTTLDGSAPDHTILIVDDSSPDGTGALADQISRDDPHVRVLHRERKQGLGQAYLAGFAIALDAGAELICEMDADFSHDPSDLVELIEAVRHGADLALGSRYTEGGGVRDWGSLRRFISRGGCLYAQLVLSLRVRDLTGGFKCFRREVLETIDLKSVRSRGYAFQVELTYRAMKSGFRVVEVPIVFSDRRVGQSKMSRSIVAEAMWMVPSLRFGAHRYRPLRGPARRVV